MKTRWCFIVMTFFFAGFFSCKDEEDEATCSTAWGVELQDELNAVNTAGLTWANDPSEANCNAYKSKYQAYINALRPYGNCSALTGQSRTDFETALEDAEESLIDLCD